MPQKTMYPAQANSPVTELASGITDITTTIVVLNGAALPEAPNLVTVGIDETAETVMYTTKTGNTLSGCVRGFGGTTARNWAQAARVGRYFTAYDYETFRGNITDHEARIQTAVQSTTADITYYVRTDGNDNNNGLANTSAGAFKTIGKAISMVPQIVNHSVNVHVAAGTYAEEPLLSGFNGAGYIGIYGTGIVNVPAMVIPRCQRVQIFGITFTSTTKVAVNTYDGGFVEFKNCNFTASSGQNGVVSYNQDCAFDTCNFSNKPTAITAMGGQVYAFNCTGTNNTNAILSGSGAIVFTKGTVHSGAILNASDWGGVINPWGDNTTAIRSSFFAVLPSDISIPGNILTKLNFSTEIYDLLDEYANTSSRFTASKRGIYQISARAMFTSAAEASNFYLRVGVNGQNTIGDHKVNNGQGVSVELQISDQLYLNAGDYVEIYALHGSATSKPIASDNTYTSFKMTRIA